MRTFLLILLSLTLSTPTISSVLPRIYNETIKLKKYQIDLDLPVRERYKELLSDNMDKIKVYAAATIQIQGWLAYWVSKFGEYLIDERRQDPEWVGYIYAVRDFANITLAEAVMLSVNYDIACTSVVLQNEQGEVILGRNLDFGTYFVLAHLVYEIDYIKDGSTLYTGIEVAGFRGAVNGVKKGKFTTSLNLRWGTMPTIQHLMRIKMGYLTPNFNLMKVMEKANSFEEAFKMMSQPNLSAPVYYTLSGTRKNQGAIFILNTDSVAKVEKLDVDAGRWFLVVTNFDPDKEEPKDDTRRIPTENSIRVVGKSEMNCESLKRVISAYPTNNLLTVFSSVQSASSGHFETLVWLP